LSNTLNLKAEKASGEIYLPTDIVFSNISIIMGAGNLDFNLKQAKVTKFSMTSGASNVKLILPQDVSSRFDFTIGAGNLNLIIPTNGELDGVKIISPFLSNMKLGELWVRVADGIETKNFDKAKVTSIIDLSKTGTVNLNITTED